MILGLVDDDRGKLNPASLVMLTIGRALADRMDVPLEAVLIGKEAEPVAVALGGFGLSAVHAVDHDLLAGYAPAAWAESAVQLAAETGASVLMAPGTDRGNEVMAHAAARAGLPMAANCTEVEPGDPFQVTRLRWGGSLLEEAALEGDVKLLTTAPNAVEPLQPASDAPAPPTPRLFGPELKDEDARVRVTGRVPSPAGRMSLAEARVVVGGGRGVGSAEGFGPLEELAGLLGGAVGCSRVVTSLGWRPHADQVGQTGVRIAPDLYIACGISGAIQHIVGCKAAKHILAINTDPEAPIMSRASHAVIGDVTEVISAVNAEIRRSVG